MCATPAALPGAIRPLPQGAIVKSVRRQMLTEQRSAGTQSTLTAIRAPWHRREHIVSTPLQIWASQHTLACVTFPGLFLSQQWHLPLTLLCFLKAPLMISARNFLTAFFGSEQG